MDTKELADLMASAEEGNIDAINRLIQHFTAEGDSDSAAEFRRMLEERGISEAIPETETAADTAPAPEPPAEEQPRTGAGGFEKGPFAAWMLLSEERKGNPYAMIQIAGRDVESGNYGNNPAAAYEKAIEALSRTGSDKETLASAHIALGKLYETGTSVKMNEEEAFKHYNAAREIDPNQYADLVRCLRNGIGCTADPGRALEMTELSVGESDITECYKFAVSLLNNNRKLMACAWLQKGLMAPNAAAHTYERLSSLLILESEGETDAFGRKIDQDDILRQINESFTNESINRLLGDVSNKSLAVKITESVPLPKVYAGIIKFARVREKVKGRDETYLKYAAAAVEAPDAEDQSFPEAELIVFNAVGDKNAAGIFSDACFQKSRERLEQAAVSGKARAVLALIKVSSDDDEKLKWLSYVKGNDKSQEAEACRTACAEAKERSEQKKAEAEQRRKQAEAEAERKRRRAEEEQRIREVRELEKREAEERLWNERRRNLLIIKIATYGITVIMSIGLLRNIYGVISLFF